MIILKIERRGRLVRQMRIEQVEKAEERLVLQLFEPSQASGRRVLANAIGLAAQVHTCGFDRPATVGQPRQIIIITCKTTTEAVPAIEASARDKRAGVVP